MNPDFLTKRFQGIGSPMGVASAQDIIIQVDDVNNPIKGHLWITLDSAGPHRSSILTPKDARSLGRFLLKHFPLEERRLGERRKS